MGGDSLFAQAEAALHSAKAQAQAPARAGKAQSPAKARQTAEEFEAQFLAQMIEHMFEGVETNGLFGGGHGEEMFRSMMFQEFGKAIAKSGGIGIADSLQREMLKTQEVE